MYNSSTSLINHNLIFITLSNYSSSTIFNPTVILRTTTFLKKKIIIKNNNLLTKQPTQVTPLPSIFTPVANNKFKIDNFAFRKQAHTRASSRAPSSPRHYIYTLVKSTQQPQTSPAPPSATRYGKSCATLATNAIISMTRPAKLPALTLL